MNIIDVGLRFDSNMSRISSHDGIAVHHSGVTVLQSVETVHNYHKNTNKWAGIGYHYYVRKDGSTYKGRPEQFAGAHCPGANSNSIAICAEGNFDIETMNNTQKQAIIELIADIKKRYNIKWIKGHREILSTSCPGKNYPLEEIRNANIVYATSPIVAQPTQSYSHSDFIKDVQRAIGASIDGIAGVETLSKTITVSANYNRTHAVVKPIQQYLYTLGYTEVGQADGIAGSKFDTAIRRFQRDNGCVIDGEITARAKTWKKLLRLA